MKYVLKSIRRRLKSLRHLQRWHQDKEKEESLSDWGRGFCEGKADTLRDQRRAWGLHYRQLRLSQRDGLL